MTKCKSSKSFCKLFINWYQVIKSSVSKMIQTGLPIMKNVIKPLAKSVLIPLGLTAAASAAFAGIHKKNLRIW